MSDSQQWYTSPGVKNFVEDKQQFFTKHSTFTNRYSHVKDSAQTARQHDYHFLSAQQFPIEEEFRHLYRVLNDQEEKGGDDLWLYCHYCSVLLSEYYSKNNYDSPSKHAEYLKIAQQIEHYYTKGQFPTEKLRSWQEHLKADIDDLLSTPFHLSKLRGWLGFTNAYRIAFTFSRLTDQEFYLAISKWAHFLRNNLHIPFDLDEINRKINSPTATFRALSVGLFIGRLLVNLSLVIKHTFFPTDGEKKIPASARFYQEIKKRYPQLLNDIVWATTNGLTNYAAFFHISGPVANTLLIAGLTFDFALIIYRLQDAEKDHQVKLLQYTQEKTILQKTLAQLLQQEQIDVERIQALQRKLKYLDAQTAEQHLKMNVLRANFHANLLAAAMIASAFSASLLFTAPAAIATCYLFIVIATALYISADNYSEYKEKLFRQNQLELSGKITKLPQAKQETSAAWKNFVTSMIKNTALPLLIMGTLAFSWQAAIVLLVLFITHEYAAKYIKTDTAHKKQNFFNTSKIEPSKFKEVAQEEHSSRRLEVTT